MKLEILAGAIGGLAIIAVVVLIVKHSETSKIETDNSATESDKYNDVNDKGAAGLPSEKQVVFDETKKEAAETITERHEDAKNIITEAVRNITSEELPDETQNDETKRKMFDEIDNL